MPEKAVMVYGLTARMDTARKIFQAARLVHVKVRNFDRAERLLDAIKNEPPIFVVLDWDTCEREAFQVLRGLRGLENQMAIPVLGFVSASKSAVGAIAQKEGCDRVYTKTEFFSRLDEFFMRYC